MRIPLILIAVAAVLVGCGGSTLVEIPIATDTERVWLGPEFYANRLQDWRVSSGTIQSVEGRRQKPMRTVHLLSHGLSGDAFEVSVIVNGAGVSESADDWGGFLLGAGSDSIDPRLSVLAHHWPAREGGVFVGIDGTGRLIVRDNATPAARTGPRGDYTTADWPLVGVADSLVAAPEKAAAAPSSLAAAPETAENTRPTSPIQLRVSFDPAAASALSIEASDPASGLVLASGIVNGIPAGATDGTIAVASHGSPRGDGLGYGFSGWTLAGKGVQETPAQRFGPVLGVMYTQSGGTLKLTAQFGPVGPADSQEAHLEQRTGANWDRLDTAAIDADARTATFRVEGWNAADDAELRVAYDLRTGEGTFETHAYDVAVPAEPAGRPFVLAGLNCHHISGGDGSWTHDHFWYPHAELVALTASKNPDMLFFAGDQIYESGLEGIVRAPTDEAILDYLNHWFRFVRAFESLTRNRPTVAIPDDHDVYHGNVWGAGGKAATGPFSPASDNGGYIMPPEFVNVVHRTQTSHLPDPIDPTPIEQGISVYYTDLKYGGISFAILADRMWKSAPRVVLPDAQIWNGWSQDLGYDGRRSDVPGAELLGARQEAFLEAWADDWSDGTWMKVVLSQTPFANVATIPEEALNGSVIPGLPNPAPGEYLDGYKKAADHDSGGWPQTPRDRAVRAMRRGFAVHVAGDQHLGTVLQYGVEDFRDAGYAFTVSSIANIWPRRWFPPEPGGNRIPGSPKYTGDHLDGFGNRMTVWAVGNPVDAGVEPKALYDRTPGLGIVRFDPSDRSVVFEAWPRWTDPDDSSAPQYADWPVRFKQQDGYGRERAGYLPAVDLPGTANPVVRVDDETSGQWLYTIRSTGAGFRPWVFDAGHSYRVRLSDPSSGREVVLSGQRVIGSGD